MKIITDIDKLKNASEPLEFLTEKGIEKEEGEEIINKLKEYLTKNKGEVAIAAPQLGINKRIFCMRFQDTIKTFINPVITKKAKYAIQPETCSSMPGKEIVIIRPEEITVVYYTDEFKYEENKLLGIAARVFDQNAQLLDGDTPDKLGLVSDVEEVGSLWDYPEEELKEIFQYYAETHRPALNAAYQKAIAEHPELADQYKQLQFSEKVINGEAAVLGKGVSKKGQAVAALSLKRSEQANHLANRAERVRFINKKRK